MRAKPSLKPATLKQIVSSCEPLAKGRWLVAVSGGGDSVAMLRLLCQAGWKERLVVGNFNHGWGAFGDESAWFVGSLAAELEIKCVLGKGAKGKASTNAEAQARRARYEWFGDVCVTEKLAGVIVAHTQDDVAELFLMRAGKGSGLQGLAGMKMDGEVSGVRVVRPLLGIGRQELRNYLNGLGQGWLEDPDNEAGGSQRARIRKLLPLLEEVGIPAESLAASVAALSDANEVVEAAVIMLAEEYLTEGAKGEAVMEQKALVNVGVEVAVRLLGRVIAEHGNAGMVVRRSKRVALWQRLCEDKEGAATLGGVKFEWKRGRVKATKEKQDAE